MKTLEPQKILNQAVLNIDSETLLECFNEGCLFTPNIDHFVLLQEDREFYEAYSKAEFVVLDSQIIYFLSKLFKKPFIAKIAGADFFPQFCEYHKQNDQIKIFLLGGMAGVAEKVRGALNDQIGRNIIVGDYPPPMNFENDDEESVKIISLISASTANVLAVALGTPKQEKWIYKNSGKLPTIAMFMGIGATLDFMAGVQKRAPRWVQNIGFEWFFRLLHDPQRLFKRYLIRDIRFFYYLIKDILQIYRNPFEK